MYKRVKHFNVVPKLPEQLKDLRTIAYNLWWSWEAESTGLLLRLNRDAWRKYKGNPVQILSTLSQEQLEKLSKDESFMPQLERVKEKLDDYLNLENTWFNVKYPEFRNKKIAYFSLEYGIADCLRIYSGGLGLLAGDHLKSASDLGLPLVGIGLLYRQGYFQQYLNNDGWQQEVYPDSNFAMMPMTPMHDKDGGEVKISVDILGEQVHAKVWKIQVGRNQLYLLDTNLPENTPHSRAITFQLYGGDLEMRMKQEILLGIGGVRALKKLGISPAVSHLNEGHSAFQAIERIRNIMEEHNISFEVAREIVASSTVFTTHTPVPAGNDIFPQELIEKYVAPYYKSIGMSTDFFQKRGRVNPEDSKEPFCMTVLALRYAAYSNAVSKLHGVVSRSMWEKIWSNVPIDEVPIHHVTNGVHPHTWVSGEMSSLFDRYIGPRWIKEPANPKIWERIAEIPDTELWRTHERRRERLVAYARRELKRAYERRGSTPTEVQKTQEVLNPEALTIGFARRFATYKRATLLLKDPERLCKILKNKEKPVQLIFSGKAHPKDDHGKKFIKELIHTIKKYDLQNHMVFLEDYSITTARYLVQGCDVWLNNPRRPLEASGTSGMKAAFNGAINMSVLDGWWDEAYNHDCGWAIGNGEDYDDEEYQDLVESKAIYELLESEIIPLFYVRERDGHPRGWIEKMKSSMMQLCPVFNTNRMVAEYTDRFYITAAKNYDKLIAEHGEKAKKLSDWRNKLIHHWHEIRIENVESDSKEFQDYNSQINVKAMINTGYIIPEELAVDLYYGEVNQDGRIDKPKTVRMKMINKVRDGFYEYQGTISCSEIGENGFTVRVLPEHADKYFEFEPGLISWA